MSGSENGGAYGFDEAQYRATAGKYGLCIDASGFRPVVRVTAEGAIVLAGGGLLAPDRIDDGFAVIQTDGETGVPVSFGSHRRGRSARPPADARPTCESGCEPASKRNARGFRANCWKRVAFEIVKGS